MSHYPIELSMAFLLYKVHITDISSLFMLLGLFSQGPVEW